MKTVQAGRNAKLASYNDYRERFNLWRHTSIDQITPDPETRSKLKALYGNNVDNVEYYVGLMAEDKGYGNSIFPPLLAAAVGAEAFRGVFGHPLLSPAVYTKETFTETGLKTLEGTTLQTLIARNLNPATVKKDHVVSFALPRKSWF